MSVNQIILRKLGFLDKIFSKKTILFISDQIYKDLKANKVNKVNIAIKTLQTRTSYNSFMSEAFIFIGDVYLALFAMRSLKTLLGKNKIVF